MPVRTLLVKDLGIVYARRKKLGWIKRVLLPGLKARGGWQTTLKLACTYERSGNAYQRCGCMCCVMITGSHARGARSGRQWD